MKELRFTHMKYLTKLDFRDVSLAPKQAPIFSVYCSEVVQGIVELFRFFPSYNIGDATL